MFSEDAPYSVKITSSTSKNALPVSPAISLPTVVFPEDGIPISTIFAVFSADLLIRSSVISSPNFLSSHISSDFSACFTSIDSPPEAIRPSSCAFITSGVLKGEYTRSNTASRFLNFLISIISLVSHAAPPTGVAFITTCTSKSE